MNNRGKGSGLALIIILIVALVAAYLAVTQMGALGFGKTAVQQEQAELQNAVQQAQDIVDMLNQAQQQAGQEP